MGHQRRGGESSDDSVAGDLLLFTAKGTLLFVLLVQGSTQLGGPIAAWLCALFVERAARRRDPSLNVLLEPALGPLDYVFLLAVAPLLAASVGGTHDDLTAGWHAFLCAAFFWRSRSSAAGALALSLAAHLFVWSLGGFNWRRWVRAAGLTPAPEGPTDIVLLLPGTALLLLLPKSSRGYTVIAACAFSDTFRRALRDATDVAADTARVAVGAALSSLALLPAAAPPPPFAPALGSASGACAAAAAADGALACPTAT